MIGVISVSAPVVLAQTPNQRAGLELFEKKIRPALIEFCYECHSADADDIGGDLLLDSRAGLLAGGESGAAIVVGQTTRQHFDARDRVQRSGDAAGRKTSRFS